MSSSNPQRSRGGRGRGRVYQQRFIPRGGGAVASTITSTTARTSPDDGPKQPHPRFAASLRSPASADLPKDNVRDGEKEASRVFIPYLPQDEAMASGLCEESSGLDAVDSQVAVDVLNDGLSWLLRLNPRQFWKEVAANDTLQKSLDCYLRYRYRWYDFPHNGPMGTVAGVIVGERELSRRVFMTLYRMSSRKDPGAAAHDCLSAKEHADLLQEKNLLDLPKLMEICAVYGHDNEELTRVLISNAMKVQPKVHEHLSSACNHFLRIADTLHKRCSSVIEALTSSDYQRDFEHKRLHSELLEVLDFINDAVVTLDAFIDAYRPAALYFCYPADVSGNQAILKTLRKLHDSLLPSLKQAFSFFSGHKESSSSSVFSVENVDSCLKTLSVRVVKIGWRLLDICYLSNNTPDDSSQMASKLISSHSDDPVTRGNMLVQMLKNIHCEVDNHVPQNQLYGSFLQNMEKSYSVLSQIEGLRASGYIFVDNEQYQHLAEILMASTFNTWEEKKVPTSSVLEKETLDENTIIMESKISQIKDLFPDYGRGFLYACLEVYNENPEEVIQRILEGTLHEDLLSLDISQEQIPRRNTISQNATGKGKGLLVEPETDKRKDKGKGLLINEPSPPWSSLDHSGGKVNNEMSSSSGRYTRKSNTEETTQVLDSKAAKDSIRSAILAAAEYDDEYDDSFDDLGLSVVESTEESEASHSEAQQNPPKWTSQKKPQFYVKDGKNYSYKVSGSVAVSNANEAAVIHQAQKDLIHGLGRGGNFPLGAAQKLSELAAQVPEDSDLSKGGSERGTVKSWGRGRRQGNYHGDGRGEPAETNTKDEVAGELPNTLDSGGRGTSNSRGRGGRGGRNHNRKNQAMKKHFVGLTGY